MGMKTLLIDIEQQCVRWGNGCLIWQGPKRRGYGSAYLEGKQVSVHRVTCEIANGPPTADKPWALHHCDTPACVEGSHLYWGNAKDNTRDMVSRGRATGGRAGATHCVHGHAFDEENTYWEPRGWGRACKTCRREAVRRMRERSRAA